MSNAKDLTENFFKTRLDEENLDKRLDELCEWSSFDVTDYLAELELAGFRIKFTDLMACKTLRDLSELLMRLESK